MIEKVWAEKEIPDFTWKCNIQLKSAIKIKNLLLSFSFEEILSLKHSCSKP